MQQLIKRFSWVGLLALSLQGAWAFSLGGPIGNNPNPVGGFGIQGDAWQQPVIAYGLPGDVNAPKNWGEGYRRNVPVYYYACDANFLDFFGSNGMAAVDGAFTILNNVFTNNPTGTANGLDGYSPDLSEFPIEARHLNYQAEALGLFDLKSWTLGLMVEQLGLCDPVRYDWTLHDRIHVNAAPPCPAGMEYLVVQRNFDLMGSPIPGSQTVSSFYSPYVNDVLYSYYIVEFCTAPNPPQATTWDPAGGTPFSVDPLADTYSPLASLPTVGLGYGTFYTGLTRDDVAGLKYLLSANTINYESAPANSLLVVTNLSSPQLITTLPFGLFLSQAQTNDPVALQALYPGLVITLTATNYSFVSTTNVTAYYTNQPGPSVTNYATLQLWTNYDLALFSSLIRTDAPAVIQALYPNLWIVSSQIVGYTNMVTTNYVTYITNVVGAPFGTFVQVTVPTGTTVNFLPLYSYIFGNILTNTYSTRSTVTNQTISVTNLIGAPAGSPLSTHITVKRVTLTNTVSGDFFIVPTNWCGFAIQATQWVQLIPSFTNTSVAAGTTNRFGAAQFTLNTIFYYTNRVYAVYPGVCEPALVFVTTTNGSVVTNYAETFANVVTNSYYTNSLVTIVTTNIGPCPGGLTNVLCTNITRVTLITNTPSGDFWIVPAAWNCGYTILSVPFTNVMATTNTILMATNAPGVADIGQQYSITLISYYTNHSLLVQPILCQMVPAGSSLREGIEKIRFVRADFDSLLSQSFKPITNTFATVQVTNSQAVYQTFQRVVTAPDIVFSAADIAAGPANPSPPNPYVTTVDRSVNFDQANALPGLAGPGLITPPTTITFDKAGPVYFNYTALGNLMDGTPYFTETPGFQISDFYYYFYFVWASFDGTTNDPVVYPDGMSFQNLANEVLVQITPTSLPNGTNGVAYPSENFTAAGGAFTYTPAPVWTTTSLPTAPPSSGLPPGLALVSNPDGTAMLSGTPTQSGTFDFYLIMTDSLGRSVQWYYSVTIQ